MKDGESLVLSNLVKLQHNKDTAAITTALYPIKITYGFHGVKPVLQNIYLGGERSQTLQYL